MISKDELLQALQGLTPEQLHGILGQGYGRSPIKPRQLDDLTTRPSATNPAPLFVASVDVPVGTRVTQSLYPALLWHQETGEEITVTSEKHKAEEIRKRGGIWLSTPPDTVVDPEAHLKAMFESLSPEDQQFVVEFQTEQRRALVTAQMAKMTPGQVAQALSGTKPKASKAAH